MAARKTTSTEGDEPAVGPAEASNQEQAITNSTATSPVEDRTATGGDTVPTEDASAADAVAALGDQGATSDLNVDHPIPSIDSQTGGQGEDAKSAEQGLAERRAALAAGSAHAAGANMETVKVKVLRANSDPVRLNVNGVGRFNLKVGETVDLPKDAVEALKGTDVSFEEVEF